MSVIARTSASQPYVPRQPADPTVVTADVKTIYDEFNGNIDTTNVKSSGAGFTGSQLASKPNGVSTANINAKAVTSVELANDRAVDASRAVGTDHIKNQSIIL